MALVMIMAGSIVGSLSALAGWTAFDLGFLQSFGVYLGISLGFGILGAMLSLSTNSDENCHGMVGFAKS